MDQLFWTITLIHTHALSNENELKLLLNGKVLIFNSLIFYFQVINWSETLNIPREANLSQPATDLIIRLCCGPEGRLGIKGADEIKKHSFFHGINYNGLRRQKSPYKPKITHATDTSNFDPIDPERIRGSDSDEEIKKPDHPENGKHPEHAFFEFTFRRFFDDGGHPYPSIKNPDELSESEKEAESNSPVYV